MALLSVAAISIQKGGKSKENALARNKKIGNLTIFV